MPEDREESSTDSTEPENEYEAAARAFFEKELGDSSNGGGSETEDLVDDSDDDNDDEGATELTTVVDDGSDDDSEAGDSSPPASLSDAELIEIAEGIAASRGDLKGLVQFKDFMANNPQVSEALALILEGKAKVVPLTDEQPPPTTKPDGTPYSQPAPENLDLDDPAIKALWDEQQGLRQTIARLESLVGTHDQHFVHQKAETAQSFVNQAKKSFAELNQLSESEMEKVAEVTGRLGILNTVMAPIDPVTGLPRQVDPLVALTQAFDAAYHMIPEYRDRQLHKRLEAEKQDKKRKQKLTSLSGSSGSVPRSSGTKAPRTAAERKAAMIKEVAEAMFPETS